MRRLLLTGTAAALIGAAAVASPATAAPEVGDDTATVCAAAAKTVTEGLQDFVGYMDEVSADAANGDLVGADKTVKDSGARLILLGAHLRKDASEADDAGLKYGVEDLAAEFERLGTSLTGLVALQNFDTDRLDKLVDDVSRTCGQSPLPEVSPSAVPS